MSSFAQTVPGQQGEVLVLPPRCLEVRRGRPPFGVLDGGRGDDLSHFHLSHYLPRYAQMWLEKFDRKFRMDPSFMFKPANG